MEKLYTLFDNLLGSLGIKSLAEGTHLRKLMNLMFVFVLFTFLASASLWAINVWFGGFDYILSLLHDLLSGLMPGADAAVVPPASGVTPELPALMDGVATPSAFMVLGHSSPDSISL